MALKGLNLWGRIANYCEPRSPSLSVSAGVASYPKDVIARIPHEDQILANYRSFHLILARSDLAAVRKATPGSASFCDLRNADARHARWP
jgi:hypothetical protein